MTRLEALEIAIKHVNSLTVNQRGYNDHHQNLTERANVIEKFARFLLEDDEEDFEDIDDI